MLIGVALLSLILLLLRSSLFFFLSTSVFFHFSSFLSASPASPSSSSSSYTSSSSSSSFLFCSSSPVRTDSSHHIVMLISWSYLSSATVRRFCRGWPRNLLLVLSVYRLFFTKFFFVSFTGFSPENSRQPTTGSKVRFR